MGTPVKLKCSRKRFSRKRSYDWLYVLRQVAIEGEGWYHGVRQLGDEFNLTCFALYIGGGMPFDLRQQHASFSLRVGMRRDRSSCTFMAQFHGLVDPLLLGSRK
jgi:hypothetical protein